MNNYEIIKPLLSFDNDTYYFIQILKRRKDNPDMEKDMTVIDEIFIYSMDDYDKRMGGIIKTCDAHNARAYIRLNKRSLKKSGMMMLKKITDLIISEDYKAIRRAYSSVSGEYSADQDKKWIIDYDFINPQRPNDWKDTLMINDIKEDVIKLQKETGREPMLVLIPSKNGVHIITRPFNLMEFRTKYGNIDIHKDNMSILYCPD